VFCWWNFTNSISIAQGNTSSPQITISMAIYCSRIEQLHSAAERPSLPLHSRSRKLSCQEGRPTNIAYWLGTHAITDNRVIRTWDSRRLIIFMSGNQTCMHLLHDVCATLCTRKTRFLQLSWPTKTSRVKNYNDHCSETEERISVTFYHLCLTSCGYVRSNAYDWLRRDCHSTASRLSHKFRATFARLLFDEWNYGGGRLALASQLQPMHKRLI